MRLAADKSSPYWRPCAQWARIFVDGVELVGLVVEASEEDGWVNMLVTDDAGRAIYAHHTADGRDDEVARYRLNGVVKILV